MGKKKDYYFRGKGKARVKKGGIEDKGKAEKGVRGKGVEGHHLMHPISWGKI